MRGERGHTAILVDPDVSSVGIDQDALLKALRGLSGCKTTLVPGLTRHPELLTGAVRASGARKAVVLSAELEHPPLAELRTWGAAGGLSPLGVQAVALDILRARRSTTERLAYAVRMVREASASLDTPATGQAVRRPVGASLSRRGLLTGHASTWVPVVEIDPRACLGTARCRQCVDACPEEALRVPDDVLSGAPVVDVSRCVACSGCLDVCPTGALGLDGHDPAALARRLWALFQSGDSAPAPALVISCSSAAPPLHHLGERGGLPGWLVLELSCLGGLGSTWYLAALAAGARAVQVLPCERCRERASLSVAVDFSRRLLAALGDADAARRIGILPAGRLPMRHAVQSSRRLSALVCATGADPVPVSDTLVTPVRVAAWAIGKLEQALSRPAQDGRPGVRHVQGEGAPLGVARTTHGCTACGVCARNCPTLAFRVGAGPGDAAWTELVFDPGACNGCGVCVLTCPERALRIEPGVDLALLAGGCVPIARVDVAPCPDCGERLPALPADTCLPPLPSALAGRCPSCRQAALIATL